MFPRRMATFPVARVHLGSRIRGSFRTGFPSRERLGPGVSLSETIAPVGVEIPEAIHSARRPANLDPIDARCPAQAEMEPRIAGRQVAAAAESLRDLARSPRFDHDAGAHAIPV